MSKARLLAGRVRPTVLLTLAFLLAAAGAAGLRADPIRFMRDPHIANGLITFSYQGDIWVANADGSGPRRLTVHPARDLEPRFSPDGRWIAFTSNRMGNADVFVVPTAGGEPRQLTFFTGNDDVQYWTPDGTGIVITSARAVHPFGAPLYIVPLDGGLPAPMPMDFGNAGMIRQDGALVAFTRESRSESRKGYRGNRSADLYVQDLATKAIMQLTDTDLEGAREHVQDGDPMWGADGMIYFVSERSGIYNIWKIAATGGAATQVTRFTSGGIKYPSISPDGRTLIFTQDYELYTMDLPAGQPRKLTVDLAFDPGDNPVDYVQVENRAEGFAPSPDGATIAVDSRGEIFMVPADSGFGEKTQVTSSARRERYQRYSPDGKRLGYISDASGDEEVWVYDIAAGSHRQLSKHASYKDGFVWSPDGSRIAFVGANHLFEIDVAAGSQRELAYNVAGGYNLAGYAPDGRWLVYTRGDEDQNADVYVFDTGARREVNVSRNPFRDAGGEITPDGRTLVFTSSRDGGTNQLFTVSLTALTEDPADPLVRARQRGARPDSAAGRGAAGRGAAPAGATPVAVTVDEAGIGERAVQITRGSNAVRDWFLSRDGRTVFFVSSDDEGAGLFSVAIDGRDRKKVTAGSFGNLTPSGDRRTVFWSQGGQGGASEIWHMPVAGTRKERIPFSFSIRVDRKAEWAQIFDESWRVMKYRFYDENMHGRDWNAIRAAYEPLLAHVGTYEDAYDLANNMIGELNASHVGVSGPPSQAMPDEYSARYLGFEMEPAGGRYRISHIYKEGPADKEWLNLAVGDYVLAIDGTDLKAGDNYWRVLNHALNEYVPVKVAKSASGAGARDVRIRTIASMSNLKYDDWVARNREYVEQVSDGQIAYVHIRAMNQPSLEKFQNEIDRFWNAKGIVVDIRYNGGGNIDQQLLDILERRPYQFWNNRWGARTWGRRPRQAIAGPKVLLINARSASDSEVTPMGFRQLGIGRIVGNPTSAMVIATGSYRLINGGSIRTPGSLVVSWDPEQPNNYGTNLENYGVAPDVLVKNSPADELAGFDRELKAAVDEALRMLREGNWQYTGESRRP